MINEENKSISVTIDFEKGGKKILYRKNDESHIDEIWNIIDEFVEPPILFPYECDLIDNRIITDPFVLKQIQSLASRPYEKMSAIQFGKEVQGCAEDIVVDIINQLTNVMCKKTPRSNNEPGYDIDTDHNDYETIQVKLRQKWASSPTSSNINISTTRRFSKKNKDAGKATGYVPMSQGEFNALAIVSPWFRGKHPKFHNQKELTNIRGNIENWFWYLIPEKEILDPNNPGYCVQEISPDILEKFILRCRSDWQNFFDNKFAF